MKTNVFLTDVFVLAYVRFLTRPASLPCVGLLSAIQVLC